jgi:hypothetical protein
MLAARRCATVATRFLFLADEDVDDDRQFLIELFLFRSNSKKRID